MGGAPTLPPRPEPASGAVQQAGAAAGAALVATRSGIGQAAEALASTATQTASAAKTGVDRLTSRVVETTTTSTAAATALAQTKASSAVAATRTAGAGAAQQAQTLALQTRELLESRIRASPGPILAGAAVLGFVLGRLV